MFGALHTTGWVQTVRAVLIAAVLVCGLSILPSEVEAQTSPATTPTWPAFPATIEAARAASYTQGMLDSITCPDGSGIKTCSGSERGTGVAMRSLCSLRGGDDDGANWCQLSFADKRYVIRINNTNFSNEVSVDISADTSGEVDPDAPERPPAGWTCTVATEGQYGCDCNLVNVGGAEGGITRMLCTSPYVTEVSDPGGGGPTVTETENEDGSLTREETPSSDNNSCAILTFNLGDCLSDIIGKIGASVLFLFVQLFMILLGLVGVLFNWIVVVTVFQYATYFGNSEGLLMAWSVLRDLGNIFLLFGFIFIGLQTILNIGHFSVGKALPRLLIFAILINFSLFVSSAIVDVSNVFSAGFYSGISGGVNCGSTEGEETPEECTGTGISGKIQAAAGLGNIADRSGSIEELWEASDGVAMFITYAGLLVFAIVMLVVLLAASIMLLSRAITLMFLLVLSPLGFAATAIPQFEEYSKMWWNKLLSQAFFAPAFLLMLFVGIKIIDGVRATFNPTGASLTTAFATGGTSSGGIFIVFALMIGFMIGSLMIASKLGAMGASFATRQAGGAVLGSIGFWGRRGGGLAAASVKKSIGANYRAISQATPKPLRGVVQGSLRSVSGKMDKLTKSSFDPRTGAPGNLLKSATGLDFGKPTKDQSHGIHGIEEAEVKKREEFAKTIKLSQEQNETLKRIEDTIKQQNTDDATEKQALETKHAGERAPLKASVDAKRLAAETATGAGKESAQTAYNAAVTDYNNLLTEQAEQREQMTQTQKSRMSVLKDQEKTAKNAALQEYIDDHKENKFYPPLSIGSHIDHETVAKLEKKMNQTDADRVLERFDKLESKLGEKDDHGSPEPGKKPH